jgi:hypothetical protein
MIRRIRDVIDAIKDTQIMTDKCGCRTIVIKAFTNSIYAYSGYRCNADHHTQSLDNNFPPQPWLCKASLLYCKHRSTPHQVTKEIERKWTRAPQNAYKFAIKTLSTSLRLKPTVSRLANIIGKVMDSTSTENRWFSTAQDMPVFSFDGGNTLVEYVKGTPHPPGE